MNIQRHIPLKYVEIIFIKETIAPGFPGMTYKPGDIVSYTDRLADAFISRGCALPYTGQKLKDIQELNTKSAVTEKKKSISSKLK